MLKRWEFVDSSNPASLARPVGHAPDHLAPPKTEKPLAGCGALQRLSVEKVGDKSPSISGREQSILKKHAVCANEASLIDQSPLSAIVSIEHPP